MGSPATSPPAVTLNGRHLAGMQSFPPPQARRQVSGDGYAPASSPLLKYRSPIGTPAPPPRRTTHPGCVLCGYVASATAQATSGSTPTSPVNTAIPLPSPVRASTPDLQRAGPSNHGFTAITPIESPTALRPLHLVQQQRETTVAGHRIIYRDDYLTAYPAEGKEALCSNGRHIVIVLNDHLASVYELVRVTFCLTRHVSLCVSQLTQCPGTVGYSSPLTHHPDRNQASACNAVGHGDRAGSSDSKRCQRRFCEWLAS